MLSHHEARRTLARMEARLHETRHNLYELERSLREKAETAAIESRPNATPRRWRQRLSRQPGQLQPD